MNEGWRSAWCQKPLLPQIPLGWALPSMPGQGEYCSWDLSALCGLCTAWCMGLAREVTCPPLVQVRDRVPQLWSGVSQPAVLVWQPRSCEHCSEDRNWACLARGKSACWIVFVYVCSHAHANLVLLDIEGENRLPFISWSLLFERAFARAFRHLLAILKWLSCQPTPVFQSRAGESFSLAYPPV